MSRPPLAARIEHVAIPLSEDPLVPLAVHARYTRVEMLAGFGIREGAKAAPWQTGVHWAADARADLPAFTLDKTSREFSPTTRFPATYVRHEPEQPMAIMQHALPGDLFAAFAAAVA